MIGGTASRWTGGKFANGAVTGAFGYLYNAFEHEKAAAKEMQSIFSKKLAVFIDETERFLNASSLKFGVGATVGAKATAPGSLYGAEIEAAFYGNLTADKSAQGLGFEMNVSAGWGPYKAQFLKFDSLWQPGNHGAYKVSPLEGWRCCSVNHGSGGYNDGKYGFSLSAILKISYELDTNKL